MMMKKQGPRGFPWIGRAGRAVRRELAVLRAVLRHPRTPRVSRWLLAAALLYLASPIDIVPDWVPLLGQLDDLVLVPALVWLALVLVPRDVVAECRAAIDVDG